MALSCNIQTTTRVDRTTKPNSPGVSSPPPPPYDYVVNNNDNQKHVTTIPDDPWLHRMTSLDETMKQMRDALQDTQAMMYETKARLSRLESSLERIAAFEPSSSPSSSIDLNRINNSLEQLIEQAQASLRSRVSLSDPTWMSVHRSTSMPELTTRFIMNRRRSSEPQNIHPKQTVSKYNAHNRQKTTTEKQQQYHHQHFVQHHHHHHYYHHHHHFHTTHISSTHIKEFFSYAISSLRSLGIFSRYPHNHTIKQYPAHQPPQLVLSQSNLFRLMLFATLLVYDMFSTFMHRGGRRLAHTSLEKLPLSTWIQRSTLLVYIIHVMSL